LSVNKKPYQLIGFFILITFDVLKKKTPYCL
jgi:hypothetical protein